MNNLYKTTKFSVTSYGRTTTVEVDHADVDMEEFLDIVKVMAIGMTFHEDTWKRSIIELGAQYEEEMREEEEKVYQPDPTLEKSVDDYFRNLSDKELDEAFAEHNSIEEDDDWDGTLMDGLEEDEWNEELETQFWNEQPPEPFATPEELAALPTECWCGDRDRCDCVSEPNDNDEFNDYGERVKEVKKVEKKTKKKKDAKRK
jgi:hypothetical protein